MLDLGREGYEAAFARQRGLNEAVIAGDAEPTVILVEHEPVITVSQRREAGEHLLASAERLEAMGIAVASTDRGGDITYHGPGQLVVYPILRLTPLGLNLSRYMRLLESVVIATLETFGIVGHREQGATGVWVARGGEPAAKVCAMGVRIRRNTTMHGLALNVDPQMSHFKTIVPCGLAGRGVTSMRELLGEQTPGMAAVKREMVRQLDAACAASAPRAAGT